MNCAIPAACCSLTRYFSSWRHPKANGPPDGPDASAAWALPLRSRDSVSWPEANFAGVFGNISAFAAGPPAHKHTIASSVYAPPGHRYCHARLAVPSTRRKGHSCNNFTYFTIFSAVRSKVFCGGPERQAGNAGRERRDERRPSRIWLGHAEGRASRIERQDPEPLAGRNVYAYRKTRNGFPR